MLKKLLFCGFACLFFIPNLEAQQFNFTQKINPFPIQDQSGTLYTFPLFGGLNAPRPQFIDIDGDNDLDLFIQENKGELILFENVGTGINYQFQWITNTYKSLDIDEWYRFVDMDGDADFDLVTARPVSLMRYYRNAGSINSPNFVLAADTLEDINKALIPAEIGSIPVLSDIDDDSDPDLFIGRQTGRVTFYRHLGMDANNLPRFEFVTDTFQGISIVGGGLTETPPGKRNVLHGANSLEYVDIDDDQDFDLFWGDFFSRSLYFLENTGNPASPHIELTDSLYPPIDPLFNGGWNVPRFADIDGDADYDMFVGEIGGAFATNSSQIDNFYFYENMGSAQNPSFTQTTNRFIVSLDIGKRCIPTLFDIDADGDLDLFIAAEVDPTDPNFSSLHFYRNIGTAASPEFKLIDPDYLTLNFGFNYSPTFVDIDADSDQDLFIGKFFGQIYFLENTGTASSPNFPSIVQDYAGIDIGNNATPTFVDIDADNDYDLFVGEFNGNINFFRNDGNASNANFVSVTDSFFNINVGLNSVPHFADIDDDNDFDLIIGSQNQCFVLYRNEGNAQNANFVLDSNFDLHSPLTSAPFFADIDDDNDLDLFSGSQGGGLVYYENGDTSTSIDDECGYKIMPSSFRLFQNFPNPFNPSTTIRYDLRISHNVELAIYNMVGQKIRVLINRRQAAGSYKVKWDGTNDDGKPVSSGIYIYRLNLGSITFSRKMLLFR